MEEREWWKRPLRVIQTNLQVKDTGKMDAGKIAREIEELCGNVLVTNVGGIYAWYQSEVKYHHVNEYLPKDRDLLKELIEECHKRGIRVVARFDFSKTEDRTYQEKPGWFVREWDRRPQAYGITRPGEWTLLYTTCINGGYHNDEVAVPVIHEALRRYDVDGVFFNAPHYERCYCDACRKKYRETYGKELPAPGEEQAAAGSPTLAWRVASAGMEPDWASRCVRDNIEKIYRAIKEEKPDAPMILYYNLYRDNLNDRLATADMLCTEPQDVLSLGYREIPQFWKPALSIRMGRTMLEEAPAPFGIIHSCPGMDWRHTGIPPAEHLFWMAQIPANGGYLWHSLTGFGDTITDKRILHSVGEINRRIAKVEDEMEGARSVSETVVLWNARESGEGWAEGLLNRQEQFDLLDSYQLEKRRLEKYRVAILPGDYPLDREKAEVLKEYVASGGNLIAEGTGGLEELCEVLGVEREMGSSEELSASYWRFEEGSGELRSGFEETLMLPHRGKVAYCTPVAGTRVLATLVPPFAPLDAVGAPPERASILCPHTELPLCTMHEYGKGKVLFLPFELSRLAQRYKLVDHYRLMQNCVTLLLGKEKAFCAQAVGGIQAMAYRGKGRLLVHFVNGIGQRPLTEAVPYHGLEFSLRLDEGEHVKSVSARIEGAQTEWKEEKGRVTCRLEKVEVWEMVSIELEE